jgi:hypothetical protein
VFDPPVDSARLAVLDALDSDVVVEACHCRAEHLPREFHGETFPQPDEAVSNSQTTLPTGI